MNITMWSLLVIVSFMSVAFMMSLQNIKHNKNYKYFRFFSYGLVFWSAISVLRNVIREPFFIYHLGFLIYPLVFLVTSFLLMTIIVYTGGRVHKSFMIFVLLFFVVDLVISLTNSYHMLMLDLDFTRMIQTRNFGPAGIGPFFYIHTIVCYGLMFLGLYELLKRFILNVKRDKDFYPFLLFFSSIIIGITFNIIHVFFKPFDVDPTFVFMIIVGIIMLDIFKKRDLMLIIDANNNRDILDNSREQYIISDHLGMVVDCSKELKKSYQKFIEEGITLIDLKAKIKEQAILFYAEKEIGSNYDKTKRYYHVKEQKVKMPHFLYFGRITLLYDETADMKLINEMDYVMSHDLMTGLYNRNYFENQIPILEKLKKPYGLILMDVDGLKLHNDYLGHKAGDELLINFSNMMQQVAHGHKGLTAIRLGGDEFLFIARDANEENLQAVAEELLSLGKHDDPINCICFSYGVSVRAKINNRFSTVLRQADKNLYLMKETKIEQKAKMEKCFQQSEKTTL